MTGARHALGERNSWKIIFYFLSLLLCGETDEHRTTAVNKGHILRLYRLLGFDIILR